MSRLSSGGGGGGGGSGTVTSVALTVPAELSVSGSPVTSAGTLAVTKATATANRVYAGPTSGGAAQPTMRALVAADIGAVNPSALTGSGTVPSAGLPAATTGALGAVQVGAGLAVDGSGVLSSAGPILLVDHETASGGEASYDTGALAGSYRHLYVVASLRSDAAAASTHAYLRFNGDSANNYSRLNGYFYGGGAGADAQESAVSAAQLSDVAAGSAPAGSFTLVEMLVPYYADANRLKMVRTTSVLYSGASSLLGLTESSVWLSSAAITALSFVPGSGSWVQHSRFSIYGLA